MQPGENAGKINWPIWRYGCENLLLTGHKNCCIKLFVGIINIHKMMQTSRYSSKVAMYLFVFVLLLGGGACKSKKKAMEAQAAAERTRLEQEAAAQRERDAELKRQQEEEERARKEAEAKKVSAPAERLNLYFSNIANSANATAANNSINEALGLFASPETPVLIVISQQGDQKDYDRPTTIRDYLNYLKDTKNNSNKISDMKFDGSGRITEIELVKQK
jgi:hypothetical protein